MSFSSPQSLPLCNHSITVSELVFRVKTMGAFHSWNAESYFWHRNFELGNWRREGGRQREQDPSGTSHVVHCWKYCPRLKNRPEKLAMIEGEKNLFGLIPPSPGPLFLECAHSLWSCREVENPGLDVPPALWASSPSWDCCQEHDILKQDPRSYIRMKWSLVSFTLFSEIVITGF